MSAIKADRIHSINPHELYSKVVVRSGVIPYTVIENEIYWLMGAAKNVIYTDFGGGCKVKNGETAYYCLLRETKEESNNLLTQVIDNALRNGEGIYTWAAYNKENEINDFLTLVPIPHQNYVKNFIPNYELESFVWVPQQTVFNPETDLDFFHSPIKRYILAFRKRGEFGKSLPSFQ